jgi:hypothetical protein
VRSFCLSRRGAERSRDQAVGRAKKKTVTKLLPLRTPVNPQKTVLFGQTVILCRKVDLVPRGRAPGGDSGIITVCNIQPN